MKWINELKEDVYGLVFALLNVLLVEIVALVIKCFNDDVSIYAGGAFVAGFIAIIIEIATTFRKSETAGHGAIIGVLSGTIFTYLLSI